MMLHILPMAILCGLVLAVVATAFLSIVRAKALIRFIGERSTAADKKVGLEVQSLRQKIEVLAGQMQELQQQPSVQAAPGLPKPGLNLSKRSQALRMHRRGEAAGRIASALEIPRQEVDLLLKVHRIVLSSLD